MKRRKAIVIIATLALVALVSTGIRTSSSKAEEIVKNNVYFASPKTAVSEVIKAEEQAEASKLARIAANKAKQEEIDRIAIERPGTSKQGKVAANYGIVNPTSNDVESARIASSGPNQTVNGAKMSTYLSSAPNIVSVLNRAVVLHNGDASNTCVYFSSEAMRRIGVVVPTATANTGQYLSYLNAHAYIRSYNIKGLTAGSICFTKPTKYGYYPTHTFVFMGWVTTGDYTLAYVADNQGSSVHVRNMGVTTATDAFDFFMHTPTPPSEIHGGSVEYNKTYINWSAVTGAYGYEVYRATSSNGSYALILRTTAKSYNNTGLTTNCTYYYKVRAYKMMGATRVYSGFSAYIGLKPIPASPISVKAISSSYDSINTSWNAVAGANGYEVYRAISSNGLYSLISNATEAKYKDTGLITNSTYYYKVRAYRMVGTLKVYSDFSTYTGSKAIPASPTSVKSTSSSYNSINTTWSAVAGANGYEVYRTTSSKVPYDLVSDTSDKSFNNTGLTDNWTYYYKIRSYRTFEETRVYSNWSVVVHTKA